MLIFLEEFLQRPLYYFVEVKILLRLQVRYKIVLDRLQGVKLQYMPQESFCDDRMEAAILVEASNAFNFVNQQAALHNISILCPALSVMLHNTYGAPTLSLCYWSMGDLFM